MNLKEIKEKIKKNNQLTVEEQRELLHFWDGFIMPIALDAILEAAYYDGVKKRYTVQDRVDHFYMETPVFIEDFFCSMAEGREFKTRFASYRPVMIEELPVS